jgi:hypothetical protein
MTILKTDIDQILQVLMNLRENVQDFVDMVYPIYKAIDWKWIGKHVTVADLIYQTHSLINLLHREMVKKIPVKDYMVATGGIVVTIHPPQNEYSSWTGTIKLEYGHMHV